MPSISCLFSFIFRAKRQCSGRVRLAARNNPYCMHAGVVPQCRKGTQPCICHARKYQVLVVANCSALLIMLPVPCQGGIYFCCNEIPSYEGKINKNKIAGTCNPTSWVPCCVLSLGACRLRHFRCLYYTAFHVCLSIHIVLHHS